MHQLRNQGGEKDEMNTYILVAISLLAAIIFSIIFSFTTVLTYEQARFQKSVIAHHCGQYNPQSGLFEWLPINEGTRP